MGKDREELGGEHGNDEETHKKREVYDCCIDKHLRKALFFKSLAHLCVARSNGKHFPDLPAHLTCFRNERDRPGNGRCTDPLLKPYQGFGKIYSPVHIAFYPADLIAEEPEIGVDHDPDS